MILHLLAALPFILAGLGTLWPAPALGIATTWAVGILTAGVVIGLISAGLLIRLGVEPAHRDRAP